MEDEDPLEGDAQEEFVESSVETAANEGQSDDEHEICIGSEDDDEENPLTED
jgi:hypothetical protein